MAEEKKEELEKVENFKLSKDMICAKGAHYFRYKTGTEIECSLCPIGYPVGPEISVKNGSIHLHGEKVVI